MRSGERVLYPAQPCPPHPTPHVTTHPTAQRKQVAASGRNGTWQSGIAGALACPSAHQHSHTTAPDRAAPARHQNALRHSRNHSFSKGTDWEQASPI